MSWGPIVQEPEAPWVWPDPPKSEQPEQIEAQSQYISPPTGTFDGSTFWGGVSGQIDEIANLDYWTLRQRSAALFYSNSYARGIIRRFVTNVINTGLEVECIPEESILGLQEDALVDWSENVENRYHLYCQSPEIIDAKGYRNDGALQRQIYTEALVCGDCLVVNRQDPTTGLPQIQVVNGDRVQTPPEKFMEPDIVDGVKIDKKGRHLGYYMYQGTADVVDDRYVYVPARGAKSGRKKAWMVYGPDKREDGVRGEPLLGIAIQPLKEISEYRASAQLKAGINSKLIGFIERTNDKPPSLPISNGGAPRKTKVELDPTGSTPPLAMTKVMDGIYFERLQVGEKPSPYSTHGTDVNFGPFEAAIVASLAWCLETPPEILTLGFQNNYSASQAALQEYKIYLNKERPRFASEHCQNQFEEWFISELLMGKFLAGDFLNAYQDPTRYDEKRAWFMTDWNGAIKPSVDIVKQTSGYKTMTSEGWITNDRTARELTGTKFSKNIQRLAKENQMKMEAMRPILEAQREFGAKNVAEAMTLLGMVACNPTDMVEEEAAA